MKRILLILAVALASLTTYSQTQVTTYKNAVGYWDNSTQQYDYQDWVYASITFTFYQTYITANDRTHSIYRILERYPDITNETSTITSYKCLDEGNRECTFGIMILKDYPDQANIGVIYSDRMFMYMISVSKSNKQTNIK